MRLNLCPSATRYQYIAISKPSSWHLRNCSTLVLTMWSCFLPHLAGWPWLFVAVALCQPYLFVVPRPFPSAEKKDKPSLTYISLITAYLLRFPSQKSVSERALIFYQNDCNFVESRRLRCETLAPFAFLFILHFFTLLYTYFICKGFSRQISCCKTADFPVN